MGLAIFVWMVRKGAGPAALRWPDRVVAFMSLHLWKRGRKVHRPLVAADPLDGDATFIHNP